MEKGKLAFLVILIFSLTLFLSGCGLFSTNQSPSASFNASPTSGNAPLEVTFNASSSSDSDGSIISYTWDFGDGSTGSGETVTHTYDSSGDYTVELTVIDNDGATDKTTKSIDVSPPSNDPPMASFTVSPESGEAPLEVFFDASGSSDSDGNIDSYTWDFGDGSTGSGETVTHTYDSSGDYTVELTVADNIRENDSTTRSISVSSSPSDEIDYRVTAEEILNEFDEDEYAAKVKYKDSTIAITGQVHNVSFDMFSDQSIVGLGEYGDILCYFSEEHEEELAELNEGDSITVVGEYSHYALSMWLYIKDCYIE